MSNPIKFNFRADVHQVMLSLQEIQQGLKQTAAEGKRWTMAMGIDAMLNNLSRLKSAISAVAGTFSAFTQAAAQKEDVSVKLGVMLGDSGAGEELATSLERMATNGVVPMQELQAAAAALVGSFSDTSAISQWVGVFADIAAGSKLPASRLAELVARVEDMGKAEFTELANAGIPIFQALGEVTGKSTQELLKMSAAGEISRDTVLEAFKLMTAEGAKFHDLNATMSNTTAGSWATLAASWQEVMAEVGRQFNDIIRPVVQGIGSFLQKYKEDISAVVSIAVRFAAIWGSIKGIKMALEMRDVVRNLKAAVMQAQSLSVAMNASKGLIGAMSAGVVALGSWVWQRAADLNAQEEEEERRRKEQWAAHWQEMEEKEKEKAAKEKEAKDKKTLDLARAEELTSIMRTARTLREFNDALKEATEKGLNSLAFDAQFGRFNVDYYRQQALQNELWDAQQSRVKKLSELEKTRTDALDKKGAAAHLQQFADADRESQIKQLTLLFAARDLAADTIGDAARMQYALGQALSSAAAKGDTARYEFLSRALPYLDAFENAENKRTASQQEAAAQKASARKKTLADISTAARRDALVMSGDTAALAAFDDAQECKQLSAQYQAAGLSPEEADFYAAQAVARKRKMAEAESAAGGQGVSLIAGNLANVGGGGRSLRLGDDQLSISKKQLGAMEAIRAIVGKIAGKATGLPVVA